MPSTRNRITRPRRPRRRGNTPDANLVKRVRAMYDWTQQELGDAIGVTQGAIGHVEQELRPLSDQLRKEIKRLIVLHNATQLLDRIVNGRERATALRCEGQALPMIDFMTQHAPQCAVCTARAAWMANPRNPHP